MRLTLQVALVSAIAVAATATSYVPASPPTGYVSPTMAPTAAPTPDPSVCWYEKRKCRWEAVASGYRCMDYYGEKYARCHPVMKYKKKCDKTETTPNPRPSKPEEYTMWGPTDSTMVSYDPNYGPHVPDYPATGTSDLYYTKKLPKHPKGVTDKPMAPPTPAPYVAYTAPPVYTTEPAYTAAPAPHTAPAYTATTANTVY